MNLQADLYEYYKRLEKENDALRLDAERYRFLQSQHWSDSQISVEVAWPVWEAAISRGEKERIQLEVNIGMYAADADQIWALMPELRNTSDCYALPEAVHEKLSEYKKREAELQELVKELEAWKEKMRCGSRLVIENEQLEAENNVLDDLNNKVCARNEELRRELAAAERKLAEQKARIYKVTHAREEEIAEAEQRGRDALMKELTRCGVQNE